MKKLILFTLVLCLPLLFLAGCGKDTDESEALEETSAPQLAEETETEPEAAGIAHGGTGFGTYPADTVVGTVDGDEITWMEYYYWLQSYTEYIQQVAAQYGFTLDGWEANDLSPTDTNADIVLLHARTTIAENHSIRQHLAELGAEISEDDLAEIQDIFDQNADMIIGDSDGEVTEEERAGFESYLEAMMHIDRDFFDTLNGDMMLSQKGFELMYGAKGEEMSDDEVMAYAEENGLMAAKHILLLTVDSATFEPIDEAEAAEKYALAEDLLARLQAVEDDPEALEALFDELMAEYTEDTGYEAYPDGYIFGEGEMVSSFEEAVKALEIGGLSGIVESEYGYHIILRTAVDPAGIMGIDSNGNTVDLRYAAATGRYSAELAEWAESAQVEWYEEFEEPDLAAIFG